MGKKKSKDRSKEDEDRPSPSSEIFESLFGDVSKNSELFSIFSDANPFKRKINELASRDSLPERGIDAGDGVKRRKVEEDKGAVVGGASSEMNGVKKEKGKRKELVVDSVEVEGEDAEKVEGRKGDAGNGDVVGLSVGLDRRDELGVDKIGIKKRKRDELEILYEANKYGEEIYSDAEGLGEKIIGKKRKKADDAVASLVPKEEGFDNEVKLLRTVFVGNLPLKMKEKALVKEFSCRVGQDSTKTPRKGAIRQKEVNDVVDRVHTYVVFKDEKSAQESLAHNMAMIGGNHIRVDKACHPRKKMKGDNSCSYDNKITLFVGNLPFDVKDEELYQLFSSISNVGSSIEAVRVVRDPNSSLGKGIAYVLFKARDVVDLVLKRRNLKLQDRDIRLSLSKPNVTPAKRSNPSPTAGSNSSGNKSVFGPIASSGENKPNKAVSLSYQGMRATKAGTPKKSTIKVLKPVQFKKEGSNKRGGVKQMTKKRPSVAARKAKDKVLREFGSIKKMDRKRKSDSKTPDCIRKNKKIQKLN